MTISCIQVYSSCNIQKLEHCRSIADEVNNIKELFINSNNLLKKCFIITIDFLNQVIIMNNLFNKIFKFINFKKSEYYLKTVHEEKIYKMKRHIVQ